RFSPSQHGRLRGGDEPGRHRAADARIPQSWRPRGGAPAAAAPWWRTGIYGGSPPRIRGLQQHPCGGWGPTQGWRLAGAERLKKTERKQQGGSMRYRKMGSTGLEVSEIALGTGDNAGGIVYGTTKEQT